jgi:imidazoleglycerol-phosphate dehydratase
MKKRTAKIQRNTAETQIGLALTIDGRGKADINTGVPFFDHMLTLLAKHSLCDLTVRAKGDLDVDSHHTIEDVGIALGQALVKALGDKRGIRRYGWALVPMDEALAQSRVSLDFSNRPYLVFKAKNWSRIANVELGRGKRGGRGVPSCGFRVGLVKEFLQGFANEARCNLHVDVLRGDEPHHIVEAIFKALAKALDLACQRDPRVKGVPSTKGKL